MEKPGASPRAGRLSSLALLARNPASLMSTSSSKGNQHAGAATAGPTNGPGPAQPGHDEGPGAYPPAHLSGLDGGSLSWIGVLLCTGGDSGGWVHARPRTPPRPCPRSEGVAEICRHGEMAPTRHTPLSAPAPPIPPVPTLADAAAPPPCARPRAAPGQGGGAEHSRLTVAIILAPRRRGRALGERGVVVHPRTGGAR